MARTSSLHRAALRMIVATITAMTMGLVGVPWAVTGLELSPAGAAAPTLVDCNDTDTLQAALDNPANTVIEINGICTGAYRIPNGRTVTLQGNPSTTPNPDGFDRRGASPRSLSGKHVNLSMSGLVFRNSRSAGSGGAIALTGTVGASFDNLLFTNNTALGGDGGAVFLTSTAPALPTAPPGIQITNSVFGDQTLTNTARSGPNGTGSGGGVFIDTVNQGVNLATNTFTNNVAARNGGAGFVRASHRTMVQFNHFLSNRAINTFGGPGPMGGGGLLIDARSASPTNNVSVAGSVFVSNVGTEAGGGLLVDALTATISGNTFTGNSLTGTITGNTIGLNSPTGAGGGFAVLGNKLNIDGNTARGNRSEHGVKEQQLANGGGGAVQTVAAGSVLRMRSNTFESNSALAEGGGAWVAVAVGGDADVLDNFFTSNRLTTCQHEHGGGLALVSQRTLRSPKQPAITGLATANQQRNSFRGNSMDPGTPTCPVPFDHNEITHSVGAGEYIRNVGTTSLDDLFIGNSIAGISPTSTARNEVEGGGLGIEQLNGNMTFYGENLVSAGNQINDHNAEGGGIYSGGSNTRVDLVNSTVSGNSVLSPSIGPGIGGGALDALFLTNTIVAGNDVVVPGSSPRPDIGGFSPSNMRLTFTDACMGSGFSGGAYPGAGNICADPALADAANGDAHETPASPTLNMGSNALVPPDLTTDFEGQPRIANGVVDMGADERAQAANLTTAKTVSPSSVKVGDNLTYVITTTNHGPDPAHGVTIADNLPSAVGFVSATPSAGGACGTVPASGASGMVSCTWEGATAAGTDRVVTIVVTAMSNGNVLNTATASSTTPDPNPDNNAGSAVAVLGESVLRPGDGITPPGSIGVDDGYCLLAEDGGVFTFGGCQFLGAAAKGPIIAPASKVVLNAPMVGFAMTPDNKGYWMGGADGGVFARGNAGYYGSMGGSKLNNPIVGIASSAGGKGYYLVASDGGVFTFGDAQYFGSHGGVKLNKPIVNIVVTPSGLGYWLVASDGGIFTYGDATFFGSTGSMKLNAPVIGMGSRPGGLGYWLVATDGGIFTFGDAPFIGSQGDKKLNRPIMAMKATSTGLGYFMVADDGGIFTFGDAKFAGSMGGIALNQPIVDMTG